MLAHRLVIAVLLAACAPKPPANTPTAPTAPAPPAPQPRTFQSWANGAVFYEVFVRSFKDSNGDGRGDLPGLIAKLDYLNDGDPATTTDLGVDALWLMPIFASPSYHGYDVTDYENINPDYGTNDDFATLMREAHRRGMKVVVDLVLNHSSDKHPWFVDSASSPTSKKRDWYVWSATELGWGQPWNASGRSWHNKDGAFYYGVFWGGMPDLNFKNPEVRAEAKRIAKLWLDRGVDGYRLDATRHLIETGEGAGQSDTDETHAFMRELAASVRAAKPDVVLIGENWTETPIIAKYFGDTSKVPGGDELPLNFDFPLASRIIAAVRQGQASLLAEKIAEIQSTYPEGATWVPFLTNHDNIRLATNLQKDAGQLRSAAAVLLTLPGTPFLYYGEEVGLQNGPGDDDESKRTPMPWDASDPGGGFTTGKRWRSFAPGQATANVAAQTADPGSLLSHYRSLIRARHASSAVQRGKLQILAAEGPLLAYLLADGAERALVVHNLGAAPASATLTFEGSPEGLYVSDGVQIEGQRVTLPPHTCAVYRLK